jgi:bla regulator protein BlaR1
MTNTRLRPLELGLLAVLAVGGFASHAAADPRHPPSSADARPSEPELNYVLLREGDRISMSGDTRDIERARRLRQGNEALLWLRDGGQEYVIRDPAILKQVDTAWKPVEELGEAQGKLGGQQGELGRHQGELGAQQGVLGTRQGALSVREAGADGGPGPRDGDPGPQDGGRVAQGDDRHARDREAGDRQRRRQARQVARRRREASATRPW